MEEGESCLTCHVITSVVFGAGRIISYQQAWCIAKLLEAQESLQGNFHEQKASRRWSVHKSLGAAEPGCGEIESPKILA